MHPIGTCRPCSSSDAGDAPDGAYSAPGGRAPAAESPVARAMRADELQVPARRVGVRKGQPAAPQQDCGRHRPHRPDAARGGCGAVGEVGSPRDRVRLRTRWLGRVSSQRDGGRCVSGRPCGASRAPSEASAEASERRGVEEGEARRWLCGAAHSRNLSAMTFSNSISNLEYIRSTTTCHRPPLRRSGFQRFWWDPAARREIDRAGLATYLQMVVRACRRGDDALPRKWGNFVGGILAHRVHVGARRAQIARCWPTMLSAHEILRVAKERLGHSKKRPSFCGSSGGGGLGVEQRPLKGRFH